MCCYVLVLRKGGGASVGLPVFGGKETPSDRSIAVCIGSPLAEGIFYVLLAASAFSWVISLAKWIIRSKRETQIALDWIRKHREELV